MRCNKPVYSAGGILVDCVPRMWQAHVPFDCVYLELNPVSVNHTNYDCFSVNVVPKYGIEQLYNSRLICAYNERLGPSLR